MPSAPGAAAAAALFSAGDVKQWSTWLSAYDAALDKVARQRKDPASLLALDKWLRQQWPKEAAKPAGLTKEALEKITRWKLSRGQWRPLMPRIMSNPQPLVEEAWGAAAEAATAAGAHMSSTRSSRTKAENVVDPAGIWKAVLALQKLDGVGPATASAILAPCFEDAPFLSDEAMVAAGCPCRYDAKTYKLFSQALASRAQVLGPPWTPERLGRALWACAVLGPDGAGAEEAAPASKKRLAERGPVTISESPPKKKPATRNA